MKIAVLGGGNMGGAIVSGAIAAGAVKPEDVVVSHAGEALRRELRKQGAEVRYVAENVDAVASAELVVLAMKPWFVEQTLAEIAHLIRPGQMVASVAAGISLEQMRQWLGAAAGGVALFRVIPNTAISIRSGVTFVSALDASDAQTGSLAALFRALGTVYIVSEEHMTPLTSLSSCGIAFAFKYIDASVKGAVELGLEPARSLEIIVQTVRGAVELLETNGARPQTEIDRVTTPGGITIKGLEAMEAAGFTEAVIEGLRKSR